MSTTRPWGKFWTLWHSDSFWIKVLHVLPNQRTSIQTHSFRSELHIGKTITYVPKEKEHCLHSGWWLEFAWGCPFENDIVRISDKYGRTTPSDVV